ncbi:hypothetical protein [Pseudoramibacter alactolyticus]|uniref:hypothetical protein n=1 Tax=Pseudoramibacter alactolyticus TaxID=113287 RepID=UPI00145CF64D|nr:hypothetical protein [Pseudoramibacter alactolyticus]
MILANGSLESLALAAETSLRHHQKSYGGGSGQKLKKLNAKTRCAEPSRSISGLAVKSIKKTIEVPMVFLLCSKLRPGGIWKLFL